MAYENNAIFWIEIEKIVPNPFQPRREFDQGKLKELSDSIRMYGILQPLVVTRREVLGEQGAFRTEYELIAGERRLRASKLAGLTQVPVIIRSGEESQLVKLELAIIENLQREDLNPVDRALAFKQLAEHFGLSHAQVAEKVGRSREYVSNSIRLLALPETILNALRTQDISDGHARTLLMLNDRPEEQDVVFREILIKKLSVREVERIARKIATEKVRRKGWNNSDLELIEIEKEFTATLGTRVEIIKTDFGGRLTIDYFEPGDLRKLLDLMHEKQTENEPSREKMFTAISAAVPLVSDTLVVGNTPIPPVVEETHVPASLSVPDAYTHADDTPYDAGGMNVYTRHDTLYVPESIPEVQDEYVPPYVPPVMENIQNNLPHTEEVEDQSQYIPTVASPIETPVPTLSPSPAVSPAPDLQKPEDDTTDLYSLKNFSL